MNMKFEGKAVKFGNNVDTDVILPGQFMTLVNPHELAKHALEGLDPSFAERAKKGVIVVGGRNFGAGPAESKRH